MQDNYKVVTQLASLCKTRRSNSPDGSDNAFCSMPYIPNEIYNRAHTPPPHITRSIPRITNHFSHPASKPPTHISHHNKQFPHRGTPETRAKSAIFALPNERF